MLSLGKYCARLPASGVQYMRFLSSINHLAEKINALPKSEKDKLYLQCFHHERTFDMGYSASQRIAALPTAKVPFRELVKFFAIHSIPMLGFGFMDNFLMILVGDSIEYSISYVFTISTMAAAALGNTFSDLCGLALSSTIEEFSSKLGLPIPKISTEQMNSRSVNTARISGRSFGLVLGCLIGMIPLLFFEHH